MIQRYMLLTCIICIYTPSRASDPPTERDLLEQAQRDLAVKEQELRDAFQGFKDSTGRAKDAADKLEHDARDAADDHQQRADATTVGPGKRSCWRRFLCCCCWCKKT